MQPAKGRANPLSYDNGIHGWSLPLPGIHVLIVDDQPNIARVTAVALGLLGYRAFTTSTTADAATLLATKKIDALFLDVNLKGESGLEFLSRLAAQDNRPPVILFTAKNTAESAGEAFRHGALGCLTKPFSMDDLRQQMAQIEQYLRQDGGSLIFQKQLEHV